MSSARATCLVVDDSEATLEVVSRHLEHAGHDVITATSVGGALALLARRRVELVITDVRMPLASGLDLVRHIRENLDSCEVVVLTGHPDVEGAVAAMKLGATDYLTKPFTEDELLGAVGQALARRALRRTHGAPTRRPSGCHGLLGGSSVMQRVYSQIERAGRTRATVLISGESGTGKELVARAIHYASERAAAPFVPVNCGAIPHELFESELFGHVKGAFTGAVEARAGFFMTADGGTLFLDEIGETIAALQVKLLRVLQDGEIRMVGSPRTSKVDARVVAATNKDLAQLVRTGAFRSDLYFRINVIPIHLPPLRDRGDDLSALIDHFTCKFATELGADIPRFTPAATRALRDYAWPGNVRELENLVQRLVVMSDGATVDTPDLSAPMRFTANGGSPQHLLRPLAEVEAEHVRAVLESVDGNKTRAAQILGIDRKTLRAKLGVFSTKLRLQ